MHELNLAAFREPAGSTLCDVSFVPGGEAFTLAVIRDTDGGNGFWLVVPENILLLQEAPPSH